MQNTRLLYPRKDAAFQLGISVRGLDYLIKNKKLAFQKIGGRVLIHWKELQRFAGSNHYDPWCLRWRLRERPVAGTSPLLERYKTRMTN